MNKQQWRRKVKRWLAKRKWYQFGQPKDNLVGGGAVACTDTCMQHIGMMVRGKKWSLNQIRIFSRGPRDGSRGLRPSEVLRGLSAMHLEYEVRSDLSAKQITKIAMSKGPVIIGENYWAHPQWKGRSYLGKKLTGVSRNSKGKKVKVGYARPYGRAGNTQPTFRDGHAVLLATGDWTGEVNNSPLFAFVRDPNHNSPVRRERPKWDRLDMKQLTRMLNSIKSSYGGKRLVYIPKRKLF